MLEDVDYSFRAAAFCPKPGISNRTIPQSAEDTESNVVGKSVRLWTATKPSVKGRPYLEFLMIRLTPRPPLIVEILVQNMINERDTCMIMVLKCVSIMSDIREAEILHKPALLADLKAGSLEEI